MDDYIAWVTYLWYVIRFRSLGYASLPYGLLLYGFTGEAGSKAS